MKEAGKVIPRRVVIFSGKAHVDDKQSNMTIQLILEVANLINNDQQIDESLKVIFLPNYNVKVAEKILPAIDLFENLNAPTS